MATVNFPNSPTLSQVYSANGKTWQYNGVGWKLVNTLSALTYTTTAGVVTIDCSGGKDILAEVTVNQNATLNLINGTNGQRILVRVLQTGSYTLTGGSMIAYSTDLTALDISTTANSRSYLGFIYFGTASKYDLLSINKGF